MNWRQLSNIRTARLAIWALFAAALAATLSAGLWPLHAPMNDVTWVPGENAISLGEHGIALGTSRFDIAARKPDSCAVELWVQPAEIWTTGTIVSFYDDQTGRQFRVAQDFADLVLVLATGKHSESGEKRELRIEQVFRRPQFFLSIASDGQNTSIYLDGRQVLRSSHFKLSGKDLSGRVILGNSALRDRSWSGKVKGLAIYGSDLNAEQALRHYREWTQSGLTVPSASERMLAQYLFREGSGSLIHSAVGAAVDLYVPERFTVVDQLHFESPISEAQTDGNYRDNAILNIVGFVPLGFAAALFLALIWKIKRVVIAATLIGTSTSLAIEYFQAYLPTRYSGMTDLVTNTIGCWIGAVLYCTIAGFLARKLARKPAE